MNREKMELRNLLLNGSAAWPMQHQVDTLLISNQPIELSSAHRVELGRMRFEPTRATFIN